MGIESDFIGKEFEWMEKRRYFMGIEANHSIDADAVYQDFIKHKWEDGFTLEERLKIQYANEILIPMAFRGEIPEKEIHIVRKRLDDFFNLLNEHDLLREELAA